MKAFLTGITALALVLLPLVIYWLLLRAHSRIFDHASLKEIVTPFLFSWLAGFIVAICGLGIKGDGSELLHYLGKCFCVAAVVIQIFCILSFIASCKRGLSNLT